MIPVKQCKVLYKANKAYYDCSGLCPAFFYTVIPKSIGFITSWPL